MDTQSARTVSTPFSPKSSHRQWLLDVIHVRLIDDSEVCVLAVINVPSQECLHLGAVERISKANLSAVLDGLVDRLGMPEVCVSDCAHHWFSALKPWSVARGIVWEPRVPDVRYWRRRIQRLTAGFWFDLRAMQSVTTRAALDLVLRDWRDNHNSALDSLPRGRR